MFSRQKAQHQSTLQAVSRHKARHSAAALQNNSAEAKLQLRLNNKITIGRDISQFVTQRVLDTTLQNKLQEKGYKGPVNGQYMSWTGENKNDADVDWKAHIGAVKKDKETVIDRVSPILIGYKMSHKFDVNDVDNLDKLVTIYPPRDQNDWAIILKTLDSVLSGVATIHEKTSKPVLSSGKIGMRHGQITALTKEKMQEAGIELVEKNAYNGFITYSIKNQDKVSGNWHGKDITWVARMGAFFFLIPGERPQAAVIWNGLLQSDPRNEWNPFGIELPQGVETQEDAEAKNMSFINRLQEEKDKGNSIRAGYYSKLYNLGLLKRP